MGSTSVSTARACFAHSTIARRSCTRPAKRCLHVEQSDQAAKVGSGGGGGARAASADLTRHVTCVHPKGSRHAHPRRSTASAGAPCWPPPPQEHRTMLLHPGEHAETGVLLRTALVAQTHTLGVDSERTFATESSPFSIDSRERRSSVFPVRCERSRSLPDRAHRLTRISVNSSPMWTMEIVPKSHKQLRVVVFNSHKSRKEKGGSWRVLPERRGRADRVLRPVRLGDTTVHH